MVAITGVLVMVVVTGAGRVVTAVVPPVVVPPVVPPPVTTVCRREGRGPRMECRGGREGSRGEL